jgi:hypothetical protein
MPASELTTGERRAAVLARNFESAFAPMRRNRAWWPSTEKHSAWAIIRVREVGPDRAVDSATFRARLLGALGEWGAFRGGSVSSQRLARHLTSSASVEALREACRLSLDEFDVARHGDLLVRLFQGLEGVKSSEAQLVFVSKTLHHLLPELIVPFDNRITCGFFGWSTLPKKASAEWLCSIYSILGDVASEVGPDTLDALVSRTGRWTRPYRRHFGSAELG